MVTIKVKKLHPEARLPTQGSSGAAGWDLYSLESRLISEGSVILVRTGIQVEIPDGYEMQIRPRSGLALKKGITVLNSPGTVDSDYRGEVGVILINHLSMPYVIEKGSRIAQAVIAPVLSVEYTEVEELSETSRSSGGFGSTGE